MERKILELIYANIDKFEVEKVDSIPKKTMITTYVEEREKNNKIYDILAARIWISWESFRCWELKVWFEIEI